MPTDYAWGHLNERRKEVEMERDAMPEGCAERKDLNDVARSLRCAIKALEFVWEMQEMVKR